jgi:hypothetical protein
VGMSVLGPDNPWSYKNDLKYRDQGSEVRDQEVGQMGMIQTSGVGLKLDVVLVIYRTVMIF